MSGLIGMSGFIGNPLPRQQKCYDCFGTMYCIRGEIQILMFDVCWVYQKKNVKTNNSLFTQADKHSWLENNYIINFKT